MQTIRQRRDLQIGKFYDHDPRHFKFERQSRGFMVEPEALPGDKFVAWVAGMVCAFLLILALLGVAV